MNRILVRLFGLPVLMISMSAAGQTADAKGFHYLPMLVNGDGFQSTLLVTNVADGVNRCSLRLLPNGLSANDFEADANLSWNGSAATFTLPNSGSRVSIAGRNLSPPEVYGSATLDCDMPAAARVLVTLSSGNAVAAAAVLPSAQMGATFKFPVLPGLGGYLLAVHNAQSGGANCRIELANEAGVVVNEQPLAVAGNASVFRRLSELAQAPADFGGGSATVSCDSQIAATGLLAGSAWSGLPPAVLSRLPEGDGTADPAVPDLVVDTVSVSDDTLQSGQSFTLRATVRNGGDGRAGSTTLRYYRSADSTISPGDTQVGTDGVGALAALAASPESITLTAPPTAGAYYYGACVDSVNGESGTANNCSNGVSVTVGGGSGNQDIEPPDPPQNASYVRDGSTAVLSWDAVAGADYYNIYHDDFSSSSCRLNSSGSASFCDELATNVTGTSYTHASPDDDRNYYWVVACNAGGCSEIDSANPAEFVDTRPAAPQNASYVRDGSTTVLSWDAVAEADYYKIYHEDLHSSSCRINSSGSPSFCEEIAANVTGTSYTHASPDDDRNYYWVVACNAGGCSEIDSANPAAFIDTRPANSPQNASYVRDGSTAVLSWDAVAGADYYNIYHDDFFGSSCRLGSSGRPSFCDEIAANVAGTSYTHASPDDDDNYYWVVACNAGGCSEIDSANPAAFIDTRPAAPRNVRASRDGSSATLSWDAVTGADYYKIYHDDFWSSGCRLNSSGSPSFCDEIAANVTGTSYTHASPDDDRNYYWVVACNAGGCSDIDGDNPIELDADGGNTGGGQADVHGDGRTSATRVSVGADVQGSLTPGDADYFRLDVSSSGTLEVYTTGGIDTVGRLEDSGGALVDSDDDGGAGGNFMLEANVDSGTYYVRVAGFGDDETGDYTLHVRFTPGTGGNDGGGDPGACRAGLVVNPGESCTYNGADFRVNSSGQGSIQAGGIFSSSSNQIDHRNATLNGVLWNFHATRNAGSNSWTIHVAD